MKQNQQEKHLAVLISHINTFASKRGFDHLKVMEDLLDYIISFLDANSTPVPGWSHGEEDNKEFLSLFIEYVNVFDDATQNDGWYDAWGDLFMELKGNSAGYRQQFFTPPGVSNLCAKMTMNPKGNFIDDPTAGSARQLLAIDSLFRKEGRVRPYLVAEDIDFICCKMAAVNMVMHGCTGEVVCHDTLNEPDSVRQGYLINPAMAEVCLPHIIKSTNPQDFRSCQLWRTRK